ncbi:MAG: hypothetical protein IH931_08570 [candidate division Zixibacteria bacterium]|nr:hypothetical protein [candidate division Zixibacteria bacterium]
MSNKINKFQASELSKLRRVKAFLRKLRYAGYLAIILVAAYTIYEISFLIKLTSGITVEKQVPANQADVEIVYSKGNLLSAEFVAKKLTDLTGGDLAVSVVGMEALEGRLLHKSLVISRQKNTKIAEMVAEKIGIDNSNVIYRAPIDKDMSPTVTLVLGEDLPVVVEEKAKEI